MCLKVELNGGENAHSDTCVLILAYDVWSVIFIFKAGNQLVPCVVAPSCDYISVHTGWWYIIYCIDTKYKFDKGNIHIDCNNISPILSLVYPSTLPLVPPNITNNTL
jgi:hypothetical protein